ncbi:glutamine-dependent NAD(+) synthetase [Coemansia helicoidea]|uniref:Glutamine-dependent NAD(+) synthetase n=1 Tax=Coemansia helicoidea TaxID=1286919 RepID=A0ACC1L3H4_9FUNG|nr:glutamine-dependent NAD(+) synthetase [Coemansia helicoidea]
MALPILDAFLAATPTAELVPFATGYVQSDEVEMGMAYDKLSVFGRLCKIGRCGPYSTFAQLHRWSAPTPK